MNLQQIAAGPCRQIEEALQAFMLSGTPVDCRRYGSGHINDTFLLTCKDGSDEHRYILQRINTHVFQDPAGLMSNVSGVTGYLRKMILEENGDPNRETLTLVHTKEDKTAYTDTAGSWWRIYLFISNASTYDIVEKAEDFYQSARAFGHFQRLLAKYPAKELTETIPNFHNTPVRFQTFQKAVQEDICGRAASAQPEIAFVMNHANDIPVIMNLLKHGQVPYRVTHNDTKLNNIMLDDTTKKGICVIDLDTIMPGSSAFDYGDSIRFGANTGAEDEVDLSKISLSLPLFETYTRGFLEGCEGSLTDTEIQMLPMGAKIMTLECGIRFLTDYLQGDTYFKIHREHHNLDRCRTQFALVADMEEKWNEMLQIVAHASAAQ